MNNLEKLLYLETLSNKPVLSFTIDSQEISSRNTNRIQNFINLLSHDASKFRKKVLIESIAEEKEIQEYYKILIQKSPQTLYFVKENKDFRSTMDMNVLRKALKDFSIKYEVCEQEIEKVIEEVSG